MKKIILIALATTLFCCGTRKVEIDKKKEESKTDSIASTKIEAKQVVKNDVVTTLERSEIVITAIDTTKAIIINKTPYFNAKIEIRQKKESKIDKSISLASEKKEIKIEKKEVSKKKMVEKQTEKTSFPWHWLLLLLIPAGYFFYKKYQNKIWWV